MLANGQLDESGTCCICQPVPHQLHSLQVQSGLSQTGPSISPTDLILPLAVPSSDPSYGWIQVNLNHFVAVTI